MLTFRIICAIFVAWAVNWALGRPEAAELMAELPQMRIFGPTAGAIIGYFNLAPRQGWGFIVAVANGVWAGLLSIILAGFLFIVVAVVVALRDGYLHSFNQFLNLVGTHGQDLADQALDLPLLIVSLGATAVAGVVTEIAHWILVRLRRARERNGD